MKEWDMKTLVKIGALAVCLLTPALTEAQMHPDVASNAPSMQVVKFRADWCGPCKVMEPALDKALNQLNDPSLQLISIDTTNGYTSQQAADIAFDANIVQHYNQWLGITGFAVMIDPDTKHALGCVNMTYDAQMMATHIANLKSLALSNTPNFDITCPAPQRAARR